MGGINCALSDSLSSAGLFCSLDAWALFCQQSACLPWYNIYRLVFHIITPHGPLLHTRIHTHRHKCQHMPKIIHTHTHGHTHNLSSGGSGVPLSFGYDREVESESNSVLLVSTGALEPCYIM